MCTHCRTVNRHANTINDAVRWVIDARNKQIEELADDIKGWTFNCCSGSEGRLLDSILEAMGYLGIAENTGMKHHEVVGTYTEYKPKSRGGKLPKETRELLKRWEQRRHKTERND